MSVEQIKETFAAIVDKEAIVSVPVVLAQHEFAPGSVLILAYKSGQHYFDGGNVTLNYLSVTHYSRESDYEEVLEGPIWMANHAQYLHPTRIDDAIRIYTLRLDNGGFKAAGIIETSVQKVYDITKQLSTPPELFAGVHSDYNLAALGESIKTSMKIFTEHPAYVIKRNGYGAGGKAEDQAWVDAMARVLYHIENIGRSGFCQLAYELGRLNETPISNLLLINPVNQVNFKTLISVLHYGIMPAN